MKKMEILLGVVFLFSFSAGYCQDAADESAVQEQVSDAAAVPSAAGTFVPADTKDYSAEMQLANEITFIKGSSYMVGLRRFGCLRGADNEDCTNLKSAIGTLEEKRFVGEGQCNAIGDDMYKRACEAFRKGDPQVCQGKEQEYCQAIINGDDTKLVEMRKRNGGVTSPEGDSLFEMGLIYGFKNYSQVACQRYAQKIRVDKSDSFSDAFSCELLFAPNYEEALEKAVKDLAVYNLARKADSKYTCGQIKNPALREACKDKRNSIYDKW